MSFPARCPTLHSVLTASWSSLPNPSRRSLPISITSPSPPPKSFLPLQHSLPARSPVTTLQNSQTHLGYPNFPGQPEDHQNVSELSLESVETGVNDKSSVSMEFSRYPKTIGEVEAGPQASPSSIPIDPEILADSLCDGISDCQYYPPLTPVLDHRRGSSEGPGSRNGNTSDHLVEKPRRTKRRRQSAGRPTKRLRVYSTREDSLPALRAHFLSVTFDARLKFLSWLFEGTLSRCVAGPTCEHGNLRTTSRSPPHAGSSRKSMPWSTGPLQRRHFCYS